MALHHFPEILQRSQLNLANPFPGDANFIADLFECCASITMQTEAPFHDRALLFTQFTHQVFNDVVHVVFLHAAWWLHCPCGVQAINRVTTFFV